MLDCITLSLIRDCFAIDSQETALKYEEQIGNLLLRGITISPLWIYPIDNCDNTSTVVQYENFIFKPSNPFSPPLHSSQKVVSKCKELGATEAFYIPLDMSNKSDTEKLIQEAETRFGGLDHLIMNHIASNYLQLWNGDWDRYQQVGHHSLPLSFHCVYINIKHIYKHSSLQSCHVGYCI